MNFIIFETESNIRFKLVNMVRLCFRTTCEHYNILEFDSYSKESIDMIKKMDGIKICIIDYNLKNKDGLYVIDKLGENNINNLYPILVYPKETIECSLICNSIIYNVIGINKDTYRNLYICLKDIFENVTKYNSLVFSYYHETYRVPYDDIYYIEKNPLGDSLTIHTTNDTYIDYCSIKKMEEILKHDDRFFKTHRSCIVNLFKIAEFYQGDNSIVFDNDMEINLVCRSKKTPLIKRLKCIK